MVKHYLEIQSRREDQLLDIYILWEEGSLQSRKMALTKYMRLTREPSALLACIELRKRYSEYIK